MKLTDDEQAFLDRWAHHTNAFIPAESTRKRAEQILRKLAMPEPKVELALLPLEDGYVSVRRPQ